MIGEGRTATRVAAGVVLAAAAISAWAGGAAASPQATVAPQVLYREALAGGRAQQSVHWTSHATSGSTGIRMDCDVGRTSGIQRISYTDGGGSGKATVVVVGGDAYLRGDAYVLTRFMQFDATAAGKYAGAWIRIPKTDRRFGDVAAGVTLSTAIGQVAMVAPFRNLASTTVHGQKVLAVAGKAPGSPQADVVFYARPGAPHLPVGAVSRAGGDTTSITFNRWNEPVRVGKPARAVLISQTGL